MAVIRINASPSGLSLHDSAQPVTARLHDMANRTGPVVILIHGYKYIPGSSQFCPHHKIFGNHANGWPEQLGFVEDAPEQGLCIALGWHARGALKSMYRRAQRLGKSIAELVLLLRRQNPQRAIHLVAHSLGSEACLGALTHLPAGAISRIVLLTGASYKRRAEVLLNTPAGRSAEVLNVTSRENDVFDALFEQIVPCETGRDRTIGQGIDVPNAVTVQIDCAQTLARLHSLGFAIAPARRRVCHWSTYTRPGLMDFYARFLRAPEHLPLALVASAARADVAPRWSRLFALPARTAGFYTALLRPKPDAIGSAQTSVKDLVRRSARNEPAY